MDSRTLIGGKQVPLAGDDEPPCYPTKRGESALQSTVTVKQSSVDALTIFLRKKIEAGGMEVFEGLRDQRRVAVKRITYSDDARDMAYNERRNHHTTENRSNHILRHYGTDMDDYYMYVSLQPWLYNLGDLVRKLCASQDTPEMRFWEASGRPSRLLVNLIRDMVTSVAELHRANIIHRDISQESFFIMDNGNEFSASLGNLGMGKLIGEEKSFGVQKREAPEQKQKKNKFEGLSNDVYLLGCVAGSLICQGQDVFDDNGSYKPDTKTILTELPDAYQMFKNLTRSPHSLRFDAQRALMDPFFWSCEQKVLFYGLVSKKLQGESDDKVFESVKNSAAEVMGKGNTWVSRLDEAFGNIVKYWGYRTNHLTDLEIVGNSQESILEYFDEKFPKLLGQVYFL